MKSYFNNRPPMGFIDFSTAHDSKEYEKQRKELVDGKTDNQPKQQEIK